MSESEKYPEHGQNSDRIQAVGELLQNVSEFIDDIKTDTPPGLHRVSFLYPVFQNEHINIPSSIETRVPDIDHIVITLGRDPELNESSLSFDFVGSQSTVYVSRSGLEEDFDQATPDIIFNHADRSTVQSEPLEAFEDRFGDMPHVTTADLNVFLMSLLYPTESTDEMTAMVLEAADFHNPLAYTSLRESLEHSALSVDESARFELDNTDIVFSYTLHNHEPSSFSILCFNETSGEMMSAQYDDNTNFELKFYSYSDAELTQKQLYIPTLEELKRITALIKTERKALRPHNFRIVEDFHELSLSDDKEQTVTMTAQQVQRALDQFGLNPPDSGA